MGVVAGQESFSRERSMIRAAMIGCGGIGQVHAELLEGQKDVAVTACCDPDLNAAQALGRLRGARPYGRLVDLLEHEALDAAWICVPPGAHEGQELLLTEAGIPFFVEKPVTLDLAYA